MSEKWGNKILVQYKMREQKNMRLKKVRLNYISIKCQSNKSKSAKKQD